ncbi:MAG TPA: DUF2203 domain-containing protein [Candidatus Saccharimonadales bacterium]|nr:DUF2203 domain-containing protein [Candidatus Saccharimonadales bacterium]
MTTFFDVDAANAALVEVAPLLATLADQRAELIRLRDASLATPPGSSGAASPPSIDVDEVRRIKLRMQGVVDQMAAAVARIDALGITLRDIERGLIDFPALSSGRQIWLCWQLGEDDVAFWHDLETGYGSRRPLIELA